ncbi:MAG: M28 family peptidase [Acidobacteria bacterium]|nr:M28 family peptidase [Acidobacteriota bacterium]
MALALFVVLLGAVVVSRREPTPAPFSAPEGQFSAERARVILGRLAGDGVPHPVGSDANDITRDKLIAELVAVGLKPTVEVGFACSPRASCATTQNVVARIHGTTTGPALVLNAHYDSVPASPGAGDDLAACSALVEVARAIRAGRLPPRDVVFLFDDGEEAGLLGAEAWVRRNDPKSVQTMVVLEARGSSGRALMFETSPGNADVVNAYARAVDSPAASSLSFAIYQLLPNDTNFTVFKRAGMHGMAIAAIGDPAQYHTPANSVKNVSPGTIQAYGDVALALARHPAPAQLGSNSNSSYFDLLGLFMLRWPESWNLPIAIIAALLVVTVLTTDIRRRDASVRGVAIALTVALLAMAATALIARGLVAVAEKRTLGVAWPASGAWLESTGWLLAVAVAAYASHLVRRRVTAADARSAYGLIWSSSAIALALLLPGGAYCITLPLLLAALVAVSGGEAGRSAAPFVALGCGVLLLVPVAIDLPLAMGASILPVVAFLVSLLALACMPLLVAGDAGARTGATAAVLAIASFAFFFITPVWTPLSPRPMSLAEFDSESGARLVAVDASAARVPRLPGEWKREAVPELTLGSRGAARTFWSSPAVAAGEPAPEATLESWAPMANGRVRVALRLRSMRGARVARIRLDPAVAPAILRVHNFTFETPVDTGVVTVHSVGREGVLIEFEATPQRGARIMLQDETPGLPAAARAIAETRSAAMVPAHRGDRLVVTRSVELTPALR